MTAGPVPVFVADYVLMGYGTGAIMAVPAHDERDLDFARAYGLPVRPLIGADGQYAPVPGLDLAGLDTEAAVAASIFWLERGGHGYAARRYRLRDWLFSRQRYWGEPFPIVYDADGRPVALPESALPVLLPELADFRPEPGAEEPVPPLARAADWATAELDLGDGVQTYRRELNTMPQWAGSCWYYLRYLDPGNNAAFVDPAVERYWMQPAGVDLYIGGVEHAVLHLLYARFWHKVLYDLGLVSTPEPFARLVNQGMIQADAYMDERGIYVPSADVVVTADGSARYEGRPVTRRSGKMGKSLKNGVSPEEMYRRYGADTLRLYEMAMGPLEVDKPWRTDDIVGVHRFLQRLWRCVIDEQTGEPTVSDVPLDAAVQQVLHATIASVRRDFGLLRFNTAIARLIELVTVATRISAAAGGLPRALAEPTVLMLAPLAPHVAEELWARLGHSASLAYAPFPVADPALAAAPAVTVPVQVNGRTRFRVEVPAGSAAEVIEQLVRAHPDYARHAGHGTVERIIVVPDRIVNIVVR
jgi:leucyl-tRNA synthetase